MEPKIDIDLSKIDLAEFLARNKISETDWAGAAIDFETLRSIGLDHAERADQLADSAAFFAKAIQKFEAVHSVRWRIKNSEHLMEKIVRKRAAGEAKYQDVSLDNYHERVTDLVGIRALHLFKEDCFSIDAPMRSTWALAEEPVAYVRQGDEGSITERLKAAGFTVKNHPAGYSQFTTFFPANRSPARCSPRCKSERSLRRAGARLTILSDTQITLTIS